MITVSMACIHGVLHNLTESLLATRTREKILLCRLEFILQTNRKHEPNNLDLKVR